MTYLLVFPNVQVRLEIGVVTLGTHKSSPICWSGWRLVGLMYHVVSVVHMKDPTPYPIRMTPEINPALLGIHCSVRQNTVPLG